MKKLVVSIFILPTLLFCLWLIFYQPKQSLKQIPLPPPPTQLTNTQMSPQHPAATPSVSNEFVRPNSIDEEAWTNKWLPYRKIVLSENQPIEFYARVLDENEKPVEGVKLKLKISRFDETIFAPTNYLHWDPALAQQDKFFDLFSDANGWIRFTGTNGSVLDMTGLSKEGYSGELPNIGSFGYEPNGQHRVGYAGMEDAFNPDKGYILHLKKE